jgi:hypothetical protein
MIQPHTQTDWVINRHTSDRKRSDEDFFEKKKKKHKKEIFFLRDDI